MCILRFSSPSPPEDRGSRRRLVSDKEEVLRLGEAEPEAVKEMRRGIMRPPRAATRIMALLVPPGPVTRTRPVGKGFIVVLPGIESRLKIKD